MKIWTAHLTRKKAAGAVIIGGILIAALILLLGRGSGDEMPDTPQLTSTEEQVAYLESLGWQVDPEPVETLQFLMPAQLSGTYLTYNELQQAQGFDLSVCCGKQVTRSTYTVNNYPDRPEGVQLNLYLCEDRPVAGDVFCPGSDGFQVGLAYPEAEGA